MFKRVLSILMAVLLLGATAAISVSAAEGTYYDPKPYVPSDDAKAVGFNRYFFLMPDDWNNEYTSSAGIYWWDGADPCGSLAAAEQGVKWPGYKIYKYNSDTKANVWYCNVPKDVTTIIFNNAFDGGDKSWDNYDPERDKKAYQTVDIGSEYYDIGESENYPSGTESFNNMIYIVDPEKTSESVTGKKTFAGEWYFYHGDGKWDTELEPTYGGAQGDVPPEDVDPIVTNPPASTTAPATATPDPAQGATSKVASADTAATTAGNGTIATGTASMAVVLLVVIASVAGVAVVLRKRKLDK
ncbi:MAG: hypothetical protein ACI4G1_05705 [Ruminococcus sp.]